jgi:protein gp37
MVTSDANWRKPLQWNAKAERGDTDTVRGGRRRLVFCASMADVFEFHPQLDAPRDRLWRLIEATPWLDWQLLTKRPMNIARMLPRAWLEHPRPNVWLGSSVEDQQRAELRIPHLVKVGAVVHFLSCEPLLGALKLEPWLDNVQWVISGGESGPHYRPVDVEWIRDLNAQCTARGVAHFFKQHGGRTHSAGGCELDGTEIKEFPANAGRKICAT